MKPFPSILLVVVGVTVGLPIGLYVRANFKTAKEACIENMQKVDGANDYSNVFIAQQSSSDLGVNVRILQGLREGRTNEAISLLEQRLTSDAVGLVASYRELPASLRERLSLTSLRYSRDYCSRYGVKSSHSDVNETVANAFKLLDEKHSPPAVVER